MQIGMLGKHHGPGPGYHSLPLTFVEEELNHLETRDTAPNALRKNAWVRHGVRWLFAPYKSTTVDAL